MIRKCGPKDEERILYIINKAAKAYKGVIPENCYHEPYMSRGELRREMNAMTFYGYEKENELVGVTGIQPLGDVTLIRHSYVLPEHQRKGIGSTPLNHLKQTTPTNRSFVHNDCVLNSIPMTTFISLLYRIRCTVRFFKVLIKRSL